MDASTLIALTSDWVYFIDADGNLARKAKRLARRFLPKPPLEPGERVLAIAAEYSNRAAVDDDIAIRTSLGRILFFSGYRCQWEVLATINADSSNG